MWRHSVGLSDGAVALRTYERGVGKETEACGTGAVAAALIDFTANGGEMRRKEMPGGDLYVAFKKARMGLRRFGQEKQADEKGRDYIFAGSLAIFHRWHSLNPQ